MGYKSDNEFIHRHRAKWLFIERGRSMTGHSIGVVEAPWRSPDPVSARRLTKYWSVSSAGRPDGIDFQTNVDWISTKMNDAQQVPRGYLHAPAGITCICIYVFAPCVRSHNRDSRLESRLQAKTFSALRETGLIMARYKSVDNNSSSLQPIRPNIRNKRPSLRGVYFRFKGNSWNPSNFRRRYLSTFRLYATDVVATPLFLIPLLQRFFHRWK